MKTILSITLSLLLITTAKSQCFEIESILVDACAGSQEGQNEMVTFKVGNTPLNTSNLTVSWPNNSWLGLTKNASTASSINIVNATITGCGYLKEPVGGVLPAHAKVLLVTSSAWNPTAHSFVNLTDTLYVIFQTAGNTAGHFANYASSGGIRTLNMSFGSPAGCSDMVTYDRGLLVNQNQLPGAQDGGAVEFTPAGIASYVNYGCQAPYLPLQADAGANKTFCANSTQTLQATVNGNYTSVNWSASNTANGTFSPSNSLSTIYTPAAGESGNIKLYFTAFKVCGTQTITVKDSVMLTVTPIPSVTITPASTSICSGQTATLQATTNTAVSYNWDNGSTNQSIAINTGGTYSVVVSNACGSASATTIVSTNNTPTISIVASQTLVCSGQTATLSTSGAIGTYTWNTGSSSPSISVTNQGVYTATVTNSCGTAVSSLSITSAPTPTINISTTTNTICVGDDATLTINSNAGNYQWNTGATSSNIIVSTAGIITASTSNACGTASASVQIYTTNVQANFQANITSGTAPLIVTFTDNSTNASNYNWNFGNGNTANTPTVNAQSYNAGGDYPVYLTVSNGLCTNTYSLMIQVLEDEPTLYVPNAFSPNNDSVNDVFKVKGTNIKQFNMLIFDRWGIKLFESNDLLEGWNGTNKNVDVPVGTYFYMIQATATNKSEISKQGAVTLFR